MLNMEFDSGLRQDFLYFHKCESWYFWLAYMSLITNETLRVPDRQLKQEIVNHTSAHTGYTVHKMKGCRWDSTCKANSTTFRILFHFHVLPYITFSTVKYQVLSIEYKWCLHRLLFMLFSQCENKYVISQCENNEWLWWHVMYCMHYRKRHHHHRATIITSMHQTSRVWWWISHVPIRIQYDRDLSDKVPIKTCCSSVCSTNQWITRNLNIVGKLPNHRS